MDLQQWWQQFLHPKGQGQPQQYQSPPGGIPVPDLGPAPQPPPKGQFTPAQLYQMYQPWLEAGIPEFPGAPGQYRTYTIKQQLAQNTPTPANKVITVTSALYEISASATAGGTADLANLDAIEIQMLIGDNNALVSALTQGSGYFDRNTGVKRFKKPWIIPGGVAMNFNLNNIGSATLNLYINLSVLELEVAVLSGG